jgi:cytoskeletal protein RodZ
MDLFRSFLLSYAVIFMLTPVSFADNAMPWDAQEDEMEAQHEMIADEKSAEQEMSSSIYGRITGIDFERKALSLLPTDQVEDEEAEEDENDTTQQYRFKSNTTVTGIDSLRELSPGDYVTLDYYAFEDRNEVTEITFDKHSENENASAETQEKVSGVLVG